MKNLKKYTKNLPELPYWSKNLLQGIVFYVGYKNCLYWDYKLMEGSIADEMCVLLNANFHSNEKAMREILFKSIANENDYGSKRGDIFICKKNDSLKSNMEVIEKKINRNEYIKNFHVNSVIEIKRYHNNFELIGKDFERISNLLNDTKIDPSMRGFVIVVSQNQLPKEFVNENTGKAISDPIVYDNYIAKVRRVCKSASSFEKKMKANYACMIEIFVKNTNEEGSI